MNTKYKNEKRSRFGVFFALGALLATLVSFGGYTATCISPSSTQIRSSII